MSFVEYYKNVRKNTTHIPYDADKPVYAIGDVHGCAEEFAILCKLIRKEHPKAIIVQLGDLIDRGPYLKEVFEVVVEFGVKTALGNHELNFILEHNGYKKCNSKARQHTHDILASYKKKDRDFVLDMMNSCQGYYVYYDGNKLPFFLSHAPLRSNTQIANDDFVGSGWSFCSNSTPYDDSFPMIAVHGHQHWNYTSIKDQIEGFINFNKYDINTDGGCVYGGELVAVDITHKNFITVPGQKYFDYN